MPWRGVVKLPGAGDQGLDRAIELELWPDSRAFAALLEPVAEPQAMLVEFDPIIRFTVWEGVLGDLSTNRLDTTTLEEVSSGIVGAGRTADLADGAALPEGEARARARRSRSPSCGSTRCSRSLATPGCPSCWPRLSSSSWDCCPRCTARGARSGCAPTRTATGRCCASAGSRCSASRSSRRSSHGSSTPSRRRPAGRRAAARPVRRGRRRPGSTGTRSAGKGADAVTDLQWARVSNDAFNVALFAYLAAMLGYFVFLAFKREGVWQVSQGGGGRGRRREPRVDRGARALRPTGCRGATCTSTRRCWRCSSWSVRSSWSRASTRCARSPGSR